MYSLLKSLNGTLNCDDSSDESLKLCCSTKKYKFISLFVKNIFINSTKYRMSKLILV